MHPKKEQTLILVKPDGLKRGIVGEVIKRFETRGLKMVALKMTQPTEKHVKQHYLSTKQQLEDMGNRSIDTLGKAGEDPRTIFGTNEALEIGRKINEWNFKFLSSSPVVAMIFEGLHAVEMARKIAGATLPSRADIGTIRGDFSVDSPILANKNHRPVRNVVHASGSIAEAKREIKHWFSAKELFSYDRVDEGIMFD